jgi:ABC-type multidrug transport system fused ATPase/permease subunit
MIKQIYNILEKKEKIKFLLIIFLMFISGLLEALSLGILAPFVSFLIDPTLFLNSYFVHKYYPGISSLSNNILVFYSLLIISFLFFLKSIYLIWFNYIKNYFIFSVSDNLLLKIFSLNLVQPYLLNLNKHSATTISNFTNENKIFIDGVLLAGIEFTSEVIILFFLFFLLFIVDPFTTFVFAVSGLFLFLSFNFFTKKKIKKWSLVRNLNDKKIIESVQHAHSGIKDILFFVKEHFFIKLFKVAVEKKSMANIKSQTLLDMPKIVIEIFAILIFTLVVLLIYIKNSSPAYFFPVLGVYVAVSFKLLPAINRILVTTQRFRNSFHSVDRIYFDLKNYNTFRESILSIMNENKIRPIKFHEKIVLKNISFRYPSKNDFVFKNLNLSINKGEVIGIIGKSGEGKSTLINIISGLITPLSGYVFCDDVNINDNIRSWRLILGYVPQNPYLFSDTIRNNVTFFDEEEKDTNSRLMESLKISQLYEFINLLPNKENTAIGERGALLSGGQAQRLVLARTIYKNPEILIFDEATSALDKENEKKILQSIKSLKGKKTIIIVSHKESALSFCDKIYRIENQKCNKVYLDNFSE